MHNAVQQSVQSRSQSLGQCVTEAVHQCQQVPDECVVASAKKNCPSPRCPESFSDVDDPATSPLGDAASDGVAQNPDQPTDNHGNLQTKGRRRSEPSKRGMHARVKRRRKSEAPAGVANSGDLSDEKTKTDVATTTPSHGKQKPFRPKKPRKSKNVQEHAEERCEPDTEEESSKTGGKQAEGSTSDDAIYTCEECGKEFPSANVLTRHKRTHSSRLFHCGECSTDFAEPMTFKRHSVVIHGIRRPFTCSHPGCHYRSDRLSNVEKHMSIHSATHAFACSRCGRTFAQDAGLRSHLLSCIASRSFLCDLCGSAFNHLQSMQSHRRVHTGERPYRCTDCDSTFADHRNYKRHRRIHDNTFPYACMLCGKRFRHSNSLKSHLGSHGIMTKPPPNLAE